MTAADSVRQRSITHPEEQIETTQDVANARVARLAHDHNAHVGERWATTIVTESTDWLESVVVCRDAV